MVQRVGVRQELACQTAFDLAVDRGVGGRFACLDLGQLGPDLHYPADVGEDTVGAAGRFKGVEGGYISAKTYSKTVQLHVRECVSYMQFTT